MFPEIAVMSGIAVIAWNVSFDRFWTRRRRSGPRHAASRSPSRRRTGLIAERLEDRRLLAATPGDGFDLGLSDIRVMPVVTPAWFASLANDSATLPTGADSAASVMIASTKSSATVAGRNGAVVQVPTARAKVAGATSDAAGTHEWIVRLSSRALESVHSVSAAADYLQQAASLGIQTASLGLDVVEGLGLPGQLLVRATAPLGTVEH